MATTQKELNSAIFDALEAIRSAVYARDGVSLNDEGMPEGVVRRDTHRITETVDQVAELIDDMED